MFKIVKTRDKVFSNRSQERLLSQFVYIHFSTVSNKCLKFIFKLSFIRVWKTDPGLTLEGDSGKEIALWRLTSLSRWSKVKFKLPCNFEESPYVAARVFSHMKMLISCTCLLKYIVSVIKGFSRKKYLWGSELRQ